MSRSALTAEGRRKPTIEDFRLGRMAYVAGWLDSDQLSDCLKQQEEALSLRREAVRFGDVAVAKGYLTRRQVRALLRVQHLHRLPSDDLSFGAIAMERGLLVRADLDEALQQQKETLESGGEPVALGTILTENGCLSDNQVRQIVQEQAMRGHGIVPRLEESAGRAMEREGSLRLEDGRVGYMAYFAGWMAEAQVEECLAEQRAAEQQGRDVPRFGEVAERKGYLTRGQVHALVHLQVIHRPTEFDRMFGAVAVRTGWLTQETVDECLREQVDALARKHEAPLLGLLMIEKKLLTPEQVRSVLVAQKEHGLGPLVQLGLPDRSGEPVAPPRGAGSHGRVWLGVAAAAVVLTAGVAAGSDWFGLLDTEAVHAIVRCRACGAVSETADTDSPDCPACHAGNSVAPLVRCVKCGTAYGYGRTGSGTRCPMCGETQYIPVRSIGEAGAAGNP